MQLAIAQNTLALHLSARLSQVNHWACIDNAEPHRPAGQPMQVRTAAAGLRDSAAIGDAIDSQDLVSGILRNP